MRLFQRVWTAGDPVHETSRWWPGKACLSIAWVVRAGFYLTIVLILIAVVGFPYLTRSLEDSCFRVSGPEVEAVLLRHRAKRTESVVRYVERQRSLVTQGIAQPDVLDAEEGWLVCPTFHAKEGR